MSSFEQINNGYNNVFQFGKLSLGIVVPVENYAQSSVPTMKDHMKRIQLVEHLGFSALWVRDVPFHVPTFGDAGQTYDPFTYLGYLAGKTSSIALGVSSIALPLHHPVHVAKSAATIDVLSDGRLILGVASGDRPNEYPAMGIPFDQRDKIFRDSFEYIRKAQEFFPSMDSKYFGKTMGDVDVLPKAKGSKLAMLVTGHSTQSIEWNAINGDGWMNYPRSIEHQKMNIENWRSIVSNNFEYSKPFMQPLYVDLQKDQEFRPQGIHLGFRIGSKHLIEYLLMLEKIGVNHVALNLRFNSLGTENTLELLAKEVLPHFKNT